jgi:hypothetical protein
MDLHAAAISGHPAVVNELMSPNDSNGATTTVLDNRKSRGEANIEAKDRYGSTLFRTFLQPTMTDDFLFTKQ